MFYLYAIVFIIFPWLFIIALVVFSRSCDDIAYSKYRPQGLCTSAGCIRCNRNKQEFRQGVENFNKNYKNVRSCRRLKDNLDLTNNDQDGLFLKLNFLYSTPLWGRDLFTMEIRRDLELLNNSRNIISLESNRALKCAYLWRRNEENGDNFWYTFSLINQGAWQEEQCRVCPQIVKLMHRFETLLSNCLFGNVFISMLPKNSEIAEHRGMTNVRLRVHFGVEIPQDKDFCYMMVGGQKIHWDYGSSVVFDDSFPHSVSSKNCQEDRIVLIMDIWHPDLTSAEKDCLTKIFPAIYV